MYKIKVNDKEYEISNTQDGKGVLNGNPYNMDFVRAQPGDYHVIHNNRSYNVELIKFVEDAKHMELLINGNKYRVSVKDDFDALLENLGLDMSLSGAEKELKAPMPGLVVDVLVEEGQELKEGDPVVILEAMKMENVLKAAGDVKVSSVEVNKGQAVEKNQVMVNFE